MSPLGGILVHFFKFSDKNKKWKLSEQSTKSVIFRMLHMYLALFKWKIVEVSYMRGDEVSDHVKGDSPPNGTENITREILHSSKKAYGMVYLWKILKQKYY